MSGKTEAEGEKARYISDEIRGEDLFGGKPLERSAETIAKLIRSNEEAGKIIGLEGGWGSGKSNLIMILGSVLRDTHHVFTYDAWGHQEDLQRRSLLESLTAELLVHIRNPRAKHVVRGLQGLPEG